MNKLIVSPSPHLFTRHNTTRIMLDVIIAMVPAIIAGAILFGPYTLLVEAVSVVSCVVFEYLLRKIMKRSNTISDLSAVVTGLLLAFNLPPTFPLWMVVVGAFFAIVIAKQLFGGIGQNFANPAIVGRIVLFISFGTQMTKWVSPYDYMYPGADAVATATPLATGLENANTLDLFLGNIGGCIGEVCALALLIGGVYLVIRKVIHPLVPLVFIGTVFVCTWIFGGYFSTFLSEAVWAFQNTGALGFSVALSHAGSNLVNSFIVPLNAILAGGVMLGAIFMATDYATTPTTWKGKLLFAFGCGLITTLIRLFGSYPEGVSFAILLMNLFTPLIDRLYTIRPFGVGGAKHV